MNRITLSLCGIVAGFLFLTFVLVGSAVALDPTNASQLVMLGISGTCPGDSGSNPLLAFGTIENSDGTSAAFSIPPHKVLVITDVELSNAQGAGFVVGVNFQLFRSTSSSLRDQLIATAEGVTSNTTGNASASFEFPKGVAVKAGVNVCFCIFNEIAGNLCQDPGHVKGALHGFLAPDK